MVELINEYLTYFKGKDDILFSDNLITNDKILFFKMTNVNPIHSWSAT
jgi:hypothetical protein